MSLLSDQTAQEIIHSFADDPSAPNVRNRFAPQWEQSVEDSPAQRIAREQGDRQRQVAEEARLKADRQRRYPARDRVAINMYSTQTSLAHKRMLEKQAEDTASRVNFRKTARVTSALGTKEEDIQSALYAVVRFNEKSVKGDVYKIRGDRQELILGKSLYPLRSEKIRQIVERDAGSVKQGEILYQSNKIRIKEHPPVKCWGTGFPCAFSCVKSGINHEMEHVVSCTIQGTIGSLCQRDGLNRSRNSKGINSIHNVLLHRIMGILGLNPTIPRVYGIKNLMKYSQHCLGLPSIELFNQAKCGSNLIDVTFKFHPGTGFPTPILETNIRSCDRIANLMIFGDSPTMQPNQSKFRMGKCNSKTLNNVLSGLYRSIGNANPNFGKCPKLSRWTNGYDGDQVRKAEKILDDIHGEPVNLSEIIKKNCDKVCSKYNGFMGGSLNGREGENGRICFAFSLLLMRVIVTSTLKELGPVGKLHPPNNTPLNRLANKAKLYLENFDSNGVVDDLATRYGGVPMSGKNGIEFFEKNDNDRDYEEWARGQRGGGIPTMKESYSSPDDEPSEPERFMKEKGVKEQPEVFRKHGEEKSAIEQDNIEGIVEKEPITDEEKKYMEEFIEDYNYLIKELEHIEKLMGEDFIISLFTCDLRLKRKKKPKTSKKKPSKKKPKKTVFGKKKKKKQSKKKDQKKAQAKAGSKKQHKKKKQTKKKKPKKKQSKREIVIDLSGLRELVT